MLQVVLRLHHPRQWHFKNLGHLPRMRHQLRLRINQANHGHHGKTAGRDNARQNPQNRHHRSLQTYFFLCLTQSSRLRTGVDCILLAPGKANLARVCRQRITAPRQQDGRPVRPPDKGNKHCRLAHLGKRMSFGKLFLPARLWPLLQTMSYPVCRCISVCWQHPQPSAPIFGRVISRQCASKRTARPRTNSNCKLRKPTHCS
jgi:hypothetical protein